MYISIVPTTVVVLPHIKHGMYGYKCNNIGYPREVCFRGNISTSIYLDYATQVDNRVGYHFPIVLFHGKKQHDTVVLQYKHGDVTLICKDNNFEQLLYNTSVKCSYVINFNFVTQDEQHVYIYRAHVDYAASIQLPSKIKLQLINI
jgi:hypothetical protein